MKSAVSHTQRMLGTRKRLIKNHFFDFLLNVLMFFVVVRSSFHRQGVIREDIMIIATSLGIGSTAPPKKSTVNNYILMITRIINPAVTGL